MSNLANRVLTGILRILSAFFNIKIRLKYVMLVVILLVGTAIGVTYRRMLENVGGKNDYDEAMRYVEIKNIVDDQFIDEVDRTSMGDSAASAMITGLGDKWSYFMSADEYRTYQLYSSSEYESIGMSIIKDEASGGFQVVSINVDSPAAWAGLTAGMVITSIDGQDVTGADEDEVRVMIRSRLDSKFVLGIGNSDSIEVDCSALHVSSVSYRLEKTMAGYVKIENFEAGTGQDVIDAVEDLLKQGAIALVLDLRGNPGGLKSELQTLLDYLLPKGILFIEEDKDGNQIVTESNGMCIQLPMCVLINTETYAEAEVCAAVLKEYQWATLMGEATTGKTRTQETIALSDGSAIRLSTRTYLTPNQVDIARNGGVVPDAIVLNSDPNATGTTEGTTGASDGTASVSNDEQLMAALKQLS